MGEHPFPRGAKFVEGAVDLDVHAVPDVVDRRYDDLGLAVELRDAGFAAALHRNHFSPTAQRARLASAATGFRLLGAAVLNATAGGVHPDVADLELRMGAVWIGLPDTGAVYSRSLMREQVGELADAIRYGSAVPVVDGDGKLLPNVHEVMELSREHDAILALGYLSDAELAVVVAAAHDHDVRKLVLAKPFSRTMQMTLSSATALLESSGAWLEINALNTFHPATDPDARVKEETLTLIHRVGPGRVLLSSDAGRPGLPGPPEAIAAGAEVLLDAGFSEADVRLMTSTNAASLVGVSVG